MECCHGQAAMVREDHINLWLRVWLLLPLLNILNTIIFVKKPCVDRCQHGESECNYNKEYFTNKERQYCGKKGHPARCCTNKKDKVKKDSDDKSVSSSKSIKSLTMQFKTLKKLVSALQAHQDNSNNDSSLSSEDGNTQFQYACVAIEATNRKVAMVLKSHKEQDLGLRSVRLLGNSLPLIYAATGIFPGRDIMSRGQ
jgi:hypothetical protein